MLFGIFRAIIVFFTLAVLLLSIFALAGSYAAKSYLTGTYLIDVQLTHLNLSSLLNSTAFASKKRADFEPIPKDYLYISDKYEFLEEREDYYADEEARAVEPRDLSDWAATATSVLQEITANTALINSATSAVAANSIVASLTANPAVASIASAATAAAASGSVPSDLSGFLTTVEAVVQDIIDRFTYQDLGLADVYSVSHWGYCRGNVTKEKSQITDLGKLGKAFDNDQISFTWCSHPVPGYKFDPLAVIKHELNNSVQGIVDGSGLSTQLTTAAKSEIQVLLDNISYESLDLPGSIENDLNTLHGVSLAAFVILVVVCVFSFISTVLQLLAFCFSPNNCCLSFLNFLWLFLTFLLSLVTSALASGAYLFVRKVVNENTEGYGVKSYLSINYYAFTWAATVAGLCAVIFHLLGHCVGLFSTGRKRYRPVGPPPGPPGPPPGPPPEMMAPPHEKHHDAEAAYEHKSLSS